jgi:hypothetical protein
MLTAEYSPKSEKSQEERWIFNHHNSFHIAFSAECFSAKKQAPEFECPPYSTNKALYDFSMLPKPKVSLKGSHFESLDHTHSNIEKTSGV